MPADTDRSSGSSVHDPSKCRSSAGSGEAKGLKVCLIAFAPFPLIGGFENVVYDLSRCLGERMDVQVISSGTTSARPVPPGVTVYPILWRSDIRYVGTLVSILVNMYRVWRHLVAHRPDVIHAHPSYPAGVFSIPAKLLNVPLIVTSHGDDVQVDESIGYGIRLNPLKRVLLRYVLRSADAHTVVSKAMIRDSVQAGSSSEKIIVINNGVDTRAIESLSKAGSPSPVVPVDCQMVLYLGRLHPKKRPKELLRAFPEVATRIPSARLVFAGRGEEEASLRELAQNLGVSEKVQLLGFVSEEQKWALLHRSDVFVLPSSVEAFGISLIEAMACGSAVVASDVPPFNEIVRDGVTGILCDAGDKSELARAIADLLADPRKRELIGVSAMNDVRERFDVHGIVDRYLEVYRSVVASR